jgi:hypothetical protein
VTIFWVKKNSFNGNSLKIGPNLFLQHFKTKIIINFVKFVATKKGMTTNFFSPLSFVAVSGFGIRDPGWVKIWIRNTEGDDAASRYGADGDRGEPGGGGGPSHARPSPQSQ